MPPQNKFVQVKAMPIRNQAMVDPQTEVLTLAQYNALLGSVKSKVLAILAHPRGEVVDPPHCPRFEGNRQHHFERCVVNSDIYPSGHCTSCAWACDANKCRAGQEVLTAAAHLQAAQDLIGDIRDDLEEDGARLDTYLHLDEAVAAFTIVAERLEGDESLVDLLLQARNALIAHVIAASFDPDD